MMVLQAGDWSCARQTTTDQKTFREVEFLLRHYFRYLLDREIRSAGWLDTLRVMNNRQHSRAVAASVAAPDDTIQP
jgi:hypothetical protein